MLDSNPQAKFIERPKCVNCGSGKLSELSRGRYGDEPLNGFLAADAWGENPLPFLQSASWSLAKCGDCSQVFHRYILDEEWNERRFTYWMSADAIKQFESARANLSDHAFKSGISHVEHILRINRLTEAMRKGSAVRLLDFGCGFGHFLDTCSSFGFEAIGVDRSIGRRSESTRQIFSTLDDVPSAHFHAITLFEVLEHLDDPKAILKQLRSRLLPNGVLVLETPNCAGVTDIRSYSDYLAVHPLEHINAFTHETLVSIAERAGFRHINRPPVFVLADGYRLAKRVAKYALRRDGRSTQLYFRSS